MGFQRVATYSLQLVTCAGVLDLIVITSVMVKDGAIGRMLKSDKLF